MNTTKSQNLKRVVLSVAEVGRPESGFHQPVDRSSGQSASNRDASRAVGASAPRKKQRRKRVQAGTTKPTVQAYWDVAETTSLNENHWQFASNLSADAVGTEARRRTVRNRARYEVENNGFATGIVRTMVTSTIATGPRFRISGPTKKAAEIVEQRFRQWCRATRFVQKLQVARRARCIDGECFVVMTTNPMLQSLVKLDFCVYEADHVEDPFGAAHWNDKKIASKVIDGIRFDRWDNPTHYYFHDRHPGGLDAWGKMRPILAEFVIHDFRPTRPEQHRGVSELLPSLKVFADYRRYSAATVLAAENAANHSLLYKTDLPPGEFEEGDDDDVEVYAEFEDLELPRNAAQFLPNTVTDVTQLKPEHPTSTHEMFTLANLREAGRPLEMPVNLSAGDSSKHNYASGRLDLLPYWDAIDVDRQHIDYVILYRLFRAFMTELLWVDRRLPGSVDDYDYKVAWPARKHADMARYAQAMERLLKVGAKTLTQEYEDVGLDAADELAREEPLIDALIKRRAAFFKL